MFPDPSIDSALLPPNDGCLKESIVKLLISQYTFLASPSPISVTKSLGFEKIDILYSFPFKPSLL